MRKHVMVWNNTHADTYRDHGKYGVDHAGSDGGVDGLSHTSGFKYACRVVEHLKEKTKVFLSLLTSMSKT